MRTVGQRQALAALSPWKTRYPLYTRLGGPQGPSGRMRKILPSTGIRSSDSPARSEALYRLSYLVQSKLYIIFIYSASNYLIYCHQVCTIRDDSVVTLNGIHEGGRYWPKRVVEVVKQWTHLRSVIVCRVFLLDSRRMLPVLLLFSHTISFRYK